MGGRFLLCVSVDLSVSVVKDTAIGITTETRRSTETRRKPNPEHYLELKASVLRTLSEGTSSRPEPGGNDAGSSQQPIAKFIALSAARSESSFYADGGHNWVRPAARQIAQQPTWAP